MAFLISLFVMLAYLVAGHQHATTSRSHAHSAVFVRSGGSLSGSGPVGSAQP